jgi:ribosomal protein S6--L-glutamate ligase
MILTAIVPGGDGKAFTLESQREQFASMFGEQLRQRGDTYEIFDVDDLALVQRGRTCFFHRGEELDPTGRVYAPTPISICPVRERKLANIYHVLAERGLPLLNRSFAASSELEVNKSVMQALVADLDIPCVPSMDLAPYMPPDDLLSAANAFGFSFPMILKPNRLSNGVGILRCDGRPDFIEKVRLIQMLKIDYLLQEFVPHSGDLRIFLSRDRLFGHKFRGPKDGDFRCGGPDYRQIAVPAHVENWSLRIAERCDADYVTIDWLVTSTGFLFHEMCSTLGAFIGVPEETKVRIANEILDIGHRKLAASSAVSGTDYRCD